MVNEDDKVGPVKLRAANNNAARFFFQKIRIFI